MTNKYDNVYIACSSTVCGPYEKKGPLSKFFDKSYDELYFGQKTFEDAESKILEDSVDLVLEKMNLKKTDIDLFISGDLLNQIVSSSYLANKLSIPYMGIYSACATSIEGLIIGANLIESKRIKNCICSTSSHNAAAEKQFRYPVEYGGIKPKTNTFTTTGGASVILSNKGEIKIESSTLGRVVDMGIKDAYYMGAVMAPACADTIYRHLTDLNRTIDYYDLVLSGDLGKYGKEILKKYMKKEYNINLKNYNDTGTMIYDIEKQYVYSGGSGPACAPLVTYSYIFNMMKRKKLKKVLLVATGALLSTTMVNEKHSIPSIAHAISLEVIN